MKVPSSFFAYRASNFVLENLSNSSSMSKISSLVLLMMMAIMLVMMLFDNYDGDANCDYDQGYEC